MLRIVFVGENKTRERNAPPQTEKHMGHVNSSCRNLPILFSVINKILKIFRKPPIRVFLPTIGISLGMVIFPRIKRKFLNGAIIFEKTTIFVNPYAIKLHISILVISYYFKLLPRIKNANGLFIFFNSSIILFFSSIIFSFSIIVFLWASIS